MKRKGIATVVCRSCGEEVGYLECCPRCGSRTYALRRKEKSEWVAWTVLVSMLDRAVGKFTAQDVRGEAIDMGYRFTPSTSSIYGRLDRHTNADLLRQVSERAGANSRVWTFTEDSDKIKDLVFRELQRRRDLRKRRI